MRSALPLPKAEFNRNFDWITRNIDALVRQHPNCWIAVDKGHVLAADRDLGEVRRMASGQSRHDEVVYHFVDDGSLIFRVS